MTLEDRLERLANRTPPGDPAEVMAAARSSVEVPSTTTTRRPVVFVAAAALLALGAGGLALMSGDDSESVTVAGTDESLVAVPESGATPQELADGTPVWVVRHQDGSVSVVDAVSAHRPFGAGTLVGWCASSRGFLDPMHGSHFDEHGRAQAGPAARGLDSYPVIRDDGDTATVAGFPVDQPRAEVGGPEPSEPAGPGCIDEFTDPVDGYLSGSFELHPFDSGVPLTPDEAVRRTDGTFVLVDAPIVIVEGSEPLVCTSAIDDETLPTCDGVPAPELFLNGETAAVLTGPFIARVSRGTLVDIAYVGGHTVTSYGPTTLRGDAAVWDVDPANPPTASATSISVLVTRLGCSGGETGDVLGPLVSGDEERIMLTFSVEPLPAGGRCPGNDSVPFLVQLDQPVGDRELVDGACMSGSVASTSHCEAGAVRWSSPTS